ncbi:hypothetical protein C8J57DRAFT_1330701 [Mycena rebaudengoi]|nr:hypothetical protein C8J57DRAFT_1330701 [Mycena rebaudengoi]
MTKWSAGDWRLLGTFWLAKSAPSFRWNICTTNGRQSPWQRGRRLALIGHLLSGPPGVRIHSSWPFKSMRRGECSGKRE